VTGERTLSEVVVAGAGTGKTHALVHAYLAALLGLDQEGQVRSPARVLAITFTDKAAAEMRRRVALGLAALARGEVSPFIAEMAEKAGTSLPKPREIERVNRHLPSAPISTFHSLCHGLLRDMAMHAGLDPGFALSSERDLSELLREVAEACVLDRLAREEMHVAELTARFGLRRMGFGRGLVDELVEVTLKLAEQGLSAADLQLVTEEHEAEARVERTRGLLDGLVRVIHEVQFDANDLVRDRAAELIRAYVRLRAALDAGRGIEEEIEVAESFELVRTLARDAFGQGELLQAREDLAGRLDELGGALCDRVTAPHGRAVKELLVDVEMRARQEKRARGVLGFGDLLIETRELLLDPGLRARVKSRYDRILVDEYQDTSPVQEDLVALLSEKTDESATLSPGARVMGAVTLEPGRLFLVGDPRQSIYGFRGADARLFRHTLASVVRPQPPMEASGARRVLTTSYRSRPPVVELVNHVARVTLTGGPHGLRLRDDEDLVAHRRPAEAPTVAGALWASARRLAHEPHDVVEARVAAVGIRGILDEGLVITDPESGEARPVRPGDIAVLVRRIRTAMPIARSLTHVGVPAQVLGGEGFFARPEICDLIAALRLIVEPDDEVATLTLLRSPFIAATDSEIVEAMTRGEPRGPKSLSRVVEAAREGALGDAADRLLDLAELFAELRPALPRETTARMIDRLLDDAGYLEAVGVEPDAALAFANIEKLRAMGEHPPGRAIEAITRLWQFLDDPPKESLADTVDPTSDAVRILTMHRSKGLEFPVVVLADLGARPPPQTQQIGFDTDLGLAVTCRGRPIEVCAPHPKAPRVTTGIDQLARARVERDRAERARLLYVALTRAQDFVYVVGADRVDLATEDRDATMRQILEEARRADPRAFDALLPKVKLSPDLGEPRPPPEAKLPDDIAPPLEVLREPVRVVPSALARGAESTRDDVPVSGRPETLERVRALRRGRLAHRLVALIGASHDLTLLDDDDKLRRYLHAAARAEGRDPNEPEDGALLRQVAATLSGPVLGLLESGFNLSFEEHTSAGAGNARVVGTVDLVARAESATWVIDFKSSRRAADHVTTRAQLTAYARALEARGEPGVAAAAWVIGDKQPPRPQSIAETDRLLLEASVAGAVSLARERP
jgi:ATP-dependent helicase/nuclease subunit A